MDRPEKFTSQWNDSDITILVEGTVLHAHSGILSFVSPVFKVMLTHDMTEKRTKQIELPGKKAADVLLMLEMIYPCSDTKFQVLPWDVAAALLSFSREYQIPALASQVDEILSAEFISTWHRKKYGTAEDIKDVVDKLLTAQEFGLPKLSDNCTTILAEYDYEERVKKAEQFKEINSDIKLLITEKNIALEKRFKKIDAVTSQVRVAAIKAARMGTIWVQSDADNKYNLCGSLTCNGIKRQGQGQGIDHPYYYQIDVPNVNCAYCLACIERELHNIPKITYLIL